jgi:hypothetical protein
MQVIAYWILQTCCVRTPFVTGRAAACRKGSSSVTGYDCANPMYIRHMTKPAVEVALYVAVCTHSALQEKDFGMLYVS